MKLDKIRFARLMALIAEEYQKFDGLGFEAIQRIDDLIDVEVPMAHNKVSEHGVNELLHQMINSDGYIPAIKAYRVLTNAGLKEAKEAVDKYRNVTKPMQSKEATLGDILATAAQYDQPRLG